MKIILNSISTSIKNIIDKYKAKFILIVIFIISLSILLTIISINKKQIIISIDGKQKNIITLANTVEKLLKDEKIFVGSKDKINLSLTSKIKDRDIIFIKRAVNITVNVDNKVLSTKSSEENIDLFLKAEGITINSEDRVAPDIKTKLTDGVKVNLVKVTTKTFTDSVPLSYETVVKSNSDLPNTSSKVTQKGNDGEKQITSTAVFENDKEVSRKVVSEVVIIKPITKIITKGTLPTLSISRGGDSASYTKVIKVRATAYYAVRGVGHTYTSSGKIAVRDYKGGYSTIAVDSSVIPYGTRLFVEGYGLAIAADTGSAIIGNTIDVYFNTYEEACNWSTRYINMYILK